MQLQYLLQTREAFQFQTLNLETSLPIKLQVQLVLMQSLS